MPVVAVGATALALAGGTLSHAALDKDVTLSVDGATSQVSTTAATVGDLLHKQGITVGSHDVVAPATSAKIADGTRIAIQYGRQVTVEVDGRQQRMWTTATRVDQALAALDVDTSGAAISTSRSSAIGRAGLSLDVATLKTVTVDAAGTKRQIRTTGKTVADVLKAAHITVDSDDQLSVAPSTLLRDGSSFTYTRVDVKRVTKTEKISFRTVRKHTDALERGATVVKTTGRAGERTITLQQVLHNGVVLSTRRIASSETARPRTQVILIGTHVAAHQAEAKKAAEPEKVAEPKKAAGPSASAVAAVAALAKDHAQERADKRADKRAEKRAAATDRAAAKRAAAHRAAAHRATAHRAAAHRAAAHQEAAHQAAERAAAKHAAAKRAAAKKVAAKKAESKKHASKKASSHQDSSPSVPSGGAWDRLAKCESGGNWSINTGNGFYGGLQFTKGTWHAYGGSGMPNHASRGRQIAVGKKVKAAQGWGAWPGCSHKLGLH